MEIILGVTGGIACYKSAELVRLFVKAWHSVRVIMTRNAEKFVTRVTFQALSGNPVYTDTFDESGMGMSHIRLPENADAFVIAPATANVIGKMASGIADDLLTTAFLACFKPVILAPAMNVHMWNNPAVRDNVVLLKKRGVRFVEPVEGELACGYEGRGRMAEPSAIVRAVESLLKKKDLSGLKLVVSAGPTREAIDPVRYISNRSSGKMGYAIAAMAAARGASVKLVTGPSNLDLPPGVDAISAVSAAEMASAVKSVAKGAAAVIMAAAVSDFAPKSVAPGKIKKGEGGLSLELAKTEDILKSLGRTKGDWVLVGFAAETEDILKNAEKKLKEKNLDLIVANRVSGPGSAFDSDTNEVTIIHRGGGRENLPRLSKSEVADAILDRVLRLVRK